MKAITVQQPWAWAIIHGGKNVENRTRIGTWSKLAGQTIAIHAGQRWSERGAGSWEVRRSLASVELGWPADDSEVWSGDMLGEYGEQFSRGAVIGLVDVVEVHPEQGGCCQPWGEQSYYDVDGRKRVDIVHLVLEEPRPVEPYPIRGALGAWTCPDIVSAGAVAPEPAVTREAVGG